MQSLLADRRMNVNAAQPDGATALSWAAYWSNATATRKLLNAGANPNIANDYGVTPLSLACKNRSTEIVRNLLRKDADPNATVWSGETALMTAAKTGDIAIIDALLAAGADVNRREPRREQSALMWAIAFGNPDAAKMLIAKGADVDARTSRLNEEFSAMQLQAYNSNVSGTAEGGYTALMFAARNDDRATAELLLNYGADVNAMSEIDGSALLIASAAGHEDLALMLLEAGADPHITDASGMTALHFALRDGLKIAHGLTISDGPQACNFGGDPDRCKPLGTLTDKEREYLDDPTSDLVINRGEIDPREPLPGRNMHRLARSLLDEGADPNAAMKFPPPHLRLARLSMFNLTGATPFFLAAASQDVVAMEMMLQREGVDSTVKTSLNEDIVDEQMRIHADDNQILGNATLFMAAVGMGRKSDFSPAEEQRAIAAAEKLILRGADVNAVTATGWTALHAAAYIGANTLIRFLVDNGAQIDVTNGCGQTPISLALGTSVDGLLDRTVPQVETAELLLELGAGSSKPAGLVGRCVLGRGGLEADSSQNELVRDRVEEVQKKLEKRLQLTQAM